MNFKRKFNLSIFFLGLIVSLVAVKPVFAEEDPLRMLQNVTTQVMAELKSHREELRRHPDKIYTLVDHLIVPHVDFSEMARWVVGRNAWKTASAAVKQEFINEFKTMVIRSYARSLLEYTDQRIEFLPLREAIKDKTRLEILSLIKGEGKEPVRMDYRLLHEEDKTWQVYDIVIEGVSLMQGYRAQFEEDVKKGGMKSVIEKMRNHNAQRHK